MTGTTSSTIVSTLTLRPDGSSALMALRPERDRLDTIGLLQLSFELGDEFFPGKTAGGRVFEHTCGEVPKRLLMVALVNRRRGHARHKGPDPAVGADDAVSFERRVHTRHGV